MTTQKPNERFVKAAFAAMALVSVLAGLGLYLLQARIGISEETARLVSHGVHHGRALPTPIVLFLWDRIFKRAGKHHTAAATGAPLPCRERSRCAVRGHSIEEDLRFC